MSVGGGEAAQIQNRRRDVEQAGAIDGLVALDARAMHDEDTQGTMLIGWPGGHVGDFARAEVVGVKAVVRADDDRGAGPRQLQEPAEH